MTWQQYILILLQPLDPVLLRVANAWKRRYNIPDELCFTAGSWPGYTSISDDCLACADENTKIMFICHGSARTVTVVDRRYDASMLAQALANAGLRRAGLLALKACLTGKSDFLDNLAWALVHRQIFVDWLIGFRDTARDVHKSCHDGTGILDYYVRKATNSHFKLPDAHRVKIVKGHPHAAPRAGSRRYT
jgi:hypothetical protein